MSESFDDLRRRFEDAVGRRDKPAAEAALAAMRAHLDQLVARAGEVATAEAESTVAEVEEHLRLEALYQADPAAYWEHAAATLRAEREARMAARGDDPSTALPRRRARPATSPGRWVWPDSPASGISDGDDDDDGDGVA